MCSRSRFGRPEPQRRHPGECVLASPRCAAGRTIRPEPGRQDEGAGVREGWRALPVMSRSSMRERTLRLSLSRVAARGWQARRIDRESPAAQLRDALLAATGADTTTTIVEVPFRQITATVDLELALGAVLSGRTAGDVVSEFAGECVSFPLQGLPLDEAGLMDLGEVETAVEGIADPDGAGLDALMTAGGLGEVRTGVGLKIALAVGQQCRSIALDDEVVVRAAAADELGDDALGQPRMGGDVLRPKVEPREQRDCGFDLVGLFEGARIGRAARVLPSRARTESCAANCAVQRCRA